MAIAYGAKLISASTTTAGPNQSTWTTGSLSNGASVGDLVVVSFATTSASSTTSLTLSDSASNTWTVSRSKATSGSYFAIAYSILTTALTTSSTFTVGGLGTDSNNRIGLIASSFTGVSARDVDGTWGSSTGTGTLTTASDLMVAISGTNGGTTTTVTPGTSFTEIDDFVVGTTGTTFDLEMAYYINAFTAGSYTYTPTYNNDGGSVYRRTKYLTFTETTSTDITVNEGNPPNVQIGGNTNTTVTATINISIDSGTSNTNISAPAASIQTGTATIVNVTTSNLNVNGITSTVSTESNISINAGTTTNIAVTGKDATVSVEISAIINAEVTNSSVHNEQANVITEQFTEIAVNESNIQVGGNTNVLELYTALVLKHDPYTYFKGDRFFTTQGSLTNADYYGLIKNYGNNPATAKHLYIWNYSNDSKTTGFGIPGDPINNGMRMVGTANGSLSVNNWGGSNTNPFILGDNLTYEFWIKTASTDFVILGSDTTDSSGYRNSSFIGLYQGKLTVGWYDSFGSPYQFVNNNFIADNAWHHIVFTKQTVGSTVTYKSYVDGEESNGLLSLSVFLKYVNPSNNKGYIMELPSDTGSTARLYNYDATIDEIAIYAKTLTKAEIQEHTKSGVGYTGITINAEKTNISLDAKDTALSTVINVDKSNININAPGATVSGDGTVVIQTTVSNVDFDGKDFTTSNTASIEISAQKALIDLLGKNVQTSTVIKAFKFVSAQDTALSANDAIALTSLEFGGLLYNQVKKLLFRLANTSNVTTKFVLSVISNETTLLPAIKLSLDNITYSSSVTIDTVLANNISDIIYVKFDTNLIDVLGPGTFLINVEQTNA